MRKFIADSRDEATEERLDALIHSVCTDVMAS